MTVTFKKNCTDQSAPAGSSPSGIFRWEPCESRTLFIQTKSLLLIAPLSTQTCILLLVVSLCPLFQSRCSCTALASVELIRTKVEGVSQSGRRLFWGGEGGSGGGGGWSKRTCLLPGVKSREMKVISRPLSRGILGVWGRLVKWPDGF